MRYNVVKDASSTISSSSYIVKNPENYKGKWNELFSNNNPIMLELGMGRGSFIIQMALAHPTVNYIGLELDKNQIATAIKNIGSRKIDNLKFIYSDAKEISNYFGKEINTIYFHFYPKILN